MNNRNNIRLFDNYGILLIDNTEFNFDIEDLPVIQGRSWYKDRDGYLVHSYYYMGHLRYVRFHRLVMNAKGSYIVDHIDRNRANNRKSNLRICERAENDRNRSVYTTNTSGITGVHFDRKREKWTASITYENKRLFIGRFELKEDAIRARLLKEVELFKEFAPQKALLEVYCEIREYASV